MIQYEKYKKAYENDEDYFGIPAVESVDGEVIPVLTGSTAVKHDEDKPRMDLLPPLATVAVAQAMGYGASKYANHNYLNGHGLDRLRLAGAALRHIFAWLAREDLDKESGLPHLAHAGASVLMLLELITRGKGKDERAPTT